MNKIMSTEDSNCVLLLMIISSRRLRRLPANDPRAVILLNPTVFF